MDRLRHNGYYYGALLYVVLIPFHQQWATIALGLWVLLSLISFQKGDLGYNKYLLLLPAFYLAYFIGFFNSEIPYFKFLETKLSLVAVPLVFFLHRYDEGQRKKLLKIFVIGLVGSAVICLVIAFYRALGFQDEGITFSANVLEGRGFMESILYGGNYFFGRFFSIFHQTVYYALYLCAGVSILLFLPRLFKSKIQWGMLIFLVLIIFLVSNKASFLTLGLIFLIRLFSSKIGLRKKGLAVIFGCVALILLVFINPRTKESVTKLVTEDLVLDKNGRYGFAPRLLSWDAARTLVKAKPILGYGAGETQQKLNSTYEQKEYSYPLKESLNAHNLWLQTWLENGVLGILILIGIFVSGLAVALKSKNHRSFYITLIVVLAVNSLFESMFNRFSGISFFSFVICFVLSSANQEKRKQ